VYLYKRKRGGRHLEASTWRSSGSLGRIGSDLAFHVAGKNGQMQSTGTLQRSVIGYKVGTSTVCNLWYQCLGGKSAHFICID
jgi:hypothetical protein